MPLEKLVQHSVLVPFPDVLAIYKMQIPQHIQGRYYFRKCKWTPEMIVASVYGVHIYLYPFFNYCRNTVAVESHFFSSHFLCKNSNS